MSAINIKPLTLKVSKPIEQDNSWEGKSTPGELAVYIASLITVDPSQLLSLNEIIFSPTTPSIEENSKIWIKTEGAPAIGIPLSGGYKMIYNYPPNVPFIWTEGIENFPIYLSRMTASSLADYSLVEPLNKKYFYVILIP